MSEAMISGGAPGTGLQVRSAILQGPARAPLQDSPETTHTPGGCRVPHSEINALFWGGSVKYPADNGRFTPVIGPIARLQGTPSGDWTIPGLQGSNSGNRGGVVA